MFAQVVMLFGDDAKGQGSPRGVRVDSPQRPRHIKGIFMSNIHGSVGSMG